MNPTLRAQYIVFRVSDDSYNGNIRYSATAAEVAPVATDKTRGFSVKQLDLSPAAFSQFTQPGMYELDAELVTQRGYGRPDTITIKVHSMRILQALSLVAPSSASKEPAKTS